MSDANINSIPSVKQMPWTAETKGWCGACRAG